VRGKAVKRRRLPKKKSGSSTSETAGDHAPCSYCGKCYNTAEDDKPDDDWIECCSCHCWMLETCAEEGGVIGDDDFLCKKCIK